MLTQQEKIIKKITRGLRIKDNKIKLKFNPEDWEEINKFLKKWDEWRREKGPMDRPNFTSDAIYLLPLTIALMRTQKQNEKLTKVLTGLTFILIIIGIIQIFKLF